MDSKERLNSGNPAALLPIGVFLVLYLGLGIIFEYVLDIDQGFYQVPAIVIFLIALFVACLQNRKLDFNAKLKVMAHGMADENILTMCLVFLAAGAFSGAVSAAGGAVSTVNLLLTFLPMDEVRRLGALEGAAINEAKRVLAFEVTKMIHGEAEAQKAADAALALFAGGAASQDVPTWEVNAAMLAEDNRLTTLLASCGLCTSRGDARKMVQQGAVLVADQKVTDVEYRIDASQIGPDGLMLRKGKKNYCRLILK